MKAHAQVRIQIRVNQHGRQQVRQAFAVGIERLLVRLVRGLAVELAMRRAQHGADLAVQAHPAVRVKVGINEDVAEQIDEVVVLGGQLPGGPGLVHAAARFGPGAPEPG